jgi:hypothetical protein
LVLLLAKDFAVRQRLSIRHSPTSGRTDENTSVYGGGQCPSPTRKSSNFSVNSMPNCAKLRSLKHFMAIQAATVTEDRRELKLVGI